MQVHQVFTFQEFFENWLETEFFLPRFLFSISDDDSPIMGVSEIGQVSACALCRQQYIKLFYILKIYSTLTFCCKREVLRRSPEGSKIPDLQNEVPKI